MMRTGKALIISIILHLIFVTILAIHLSRRSGGEAAAKGIYVDLNVRLERPRVKRISPPRIVQPLLSTPRPSSSTKPIVKLPPPVLRGITTAARISGPSEGFDVVPDLGGTTGSGLAEPKRTLSNPASIPSYSLIRKPKLLRFVGGLGERRRIVYCLDVSASMSSGFDKLGMAKAYLRQSISDLSENDMFDLIAFHERTIRFRRNPVPATEKNVALAFRFMERFTAESTRGNDRTDLFAPLSDALRMNPDLIVLVTDGLPNAGILNPTELARKFKKANRIKARIYAIGMGLNEKSPGAYMLRRLALENEGDFELISP